MAQMRGTGLRTLRRVLKLVLVFGTASSTCSFAGAQQKESSMKRVRARSCGSIWIRTSSTTPMTSNVYAPNQADVAEAVERLRARARSTAFRRNAWLTDPPTSEKLDIIKRNGRMRRAMSLIMACAVRNGWLRSIDALPGGNVAPLPVP